MPAANPNLQRRDKAGPKTSVAPVRNPESKPEWARFPSLGARRFPNAATSNLIGSHLTGSHARLGKCCCTRRTTMDTMQPHLSQPSINLISGPDIGAQGHFLELATNQSPHRCSKHVQLRGCRPNPNPSYSTVAFWRSPRTTTLGNRAKVPFIPGADRADQSVVTSDI